MKHVSHSPAKSHSPLVIQLHAGCPPSTGETRWLRHHDLEMCYGQLVGEKRSFGQAERWCRDHDAHLAMPRTDAQLTAIADFTSTTRNGVVWVGIDNIEQRRLWKWADGEVPDTKQLRWKKGEPTNNGQRCVTLPTQVIPLRFQNNFCWELFEFVCERPDWRVVRKPLENRCLPGWVYFDCGDDCYWAPILTRTYVEAVSVCNEKGAQLAMPKLLRQRRDVMLTMKQSNETKLDFEALAAWIGLKAIAAKLWEWADGSVVYKDLKPNFNSTEAKNCVAMDLKGKVGLYPCQNKKYLVCRKRQTPSTTPNQAVCGKTQKLVDSSVAAYSRSTGKVFQTQRLSKHFRNRVSKRLLNRNGNKNIFRRETVSYIRKLNIGFIHNGKNISVADFPWFARLERRNNKKRATCGGVLISPRHVVTATHCVHSSSGTIVPDADIVVGLGSAYKDIDVAGSFEEIQMYKAHAFFKHGTILERNGARLEQFLYDIAIIELKRDVQLDCHHVKPVCLPSKTYSSFAGLRCVQVGLGQGSGLTLKYCDVDLKKLSLTDTHITLTFREGESCHSNRGDSGSPLVCIDDAAAEPRWTLMGVVNGASGDMKVLTRTDAYIQWINSNKGTGEPDKLNQDIVCDGEELEISCDHGRPPTIRVEKAVYGRTSGTTCQTSGGPPVKLGCFSDVTEILAKRCNRKNFCKFTVDTDHLEDPCPGFSKYLELTYRCVSLGTRGKYLHEVQCLNQEKYMILSCGVGNRYSIEVLYATFGKQSPSVCPAHAENAHTSCKYIDITRDVAERCNKKQYCVNFSPTHDLGEPCNKEDKYVEANYTCLPEYDKRFQLCSSEGRLNITCEELVHHHIEVTTATFGRGSSAKCFKGSFEADCGNIDITDAIAASCSGTVSCQKTLSSKLAGDPCPGKKKYFEVFYRCVPDKTVVQCDGEEHVELNCGAARPHNIRVTSAHIGQAEVCGAHPSDNQTCARKDLTSLLAGKCDGKRTCEEPIGGTYKRDTCNVHARSLEVVYSCVPEHVAHVCYDGGELSLSCDPRMINVSLAVYGKGSLGPCDFKGDRVNRGCRGTPVTDTIAKICNRKKSCATLIDFQAWGDPCPEFPKYLEVFYTCV